MTPLVLDPAVQYRHAERTEGSWPVGDGEACVIAGDEGSCDDQQESGEGYE